MKKSGALIVLVLFTGVSIVFVVGDLADYGPPVPIAIVPDLLSRPRFTTVRSTLIGTRRTFDFSG